MRVQNRKVNSKMPTNILRLIMENTYEYNIEVHIFFLDFKQTFDKLNGIKMLEFENSNIRNNVMRII